MELLFAPMEGITGAAYRRVHARLFPGVDAYFAPFIAPDASGSFKLGLLRDVLPDNNPGVTLIPQLLVNKPEPFIAVAKALSNLGYDEVNLNVGCPSATVVAKHKGAGMLADLESLDHCLYEIFAACPQKISVKTRLGLNSVEQFPEILGIYNKYPISRLIIHARDRAGMYKSDPALDVYKAAIGHSAAPLCYNGNIFSAAGLEETLRELGDVKTVMLGRGAAANPGLFREIKTGQKLSASQMQSFHDELLEEYLSTGLDSRFAMARLKELWFYMQSSFPEQGKSMKRIFKSQRLPDYRNDVSALFAGGGFSPDGVFVPPV